MFGSVKFNMSQESQKRPDENPFDFDDFKSKISGENRGSLESQQPQERVSEKSKKEDINFSMFGSVKSASKEQVDLDDFASKVSGEKRESIESQVVPVKTEKSKTEDINFSMFGSVKSGKSQKSQIA